METTAPPARAAPPGVAIVGGGPAGLRAAEVAAGAGAAVTVTVYDAMPSVGRKFLVAGKSGLNLTNTAPPPEFLARYTTPGLARETWEAIVSAFDNTALREWARTLGIGTFESAGGKVFPEQMKAAPLLRAWVRRLKASGVTFAMRHRLSAVGPGPELGFSTPAGRETVRPDAAVLALGGASWPQTGSDGSWTALLAARGIALTPFAAANCGWEVPWPEPLLGEAEGLPLKNIAAQSGSRRELGELVITRYGLEGAPVYRLGPELRGGGALTLDLKPSLPEETVAARLAPVTRNYVREARRRLKLPPAAAALLKHLPGIGPWSSPGALAGAIKACPVPVTGPRPLSEAISTAGGIAWGALTPDLMLAALPGVFAAGEMLDWEAPTGGFLLQACFATGHHAGAAAVSFAR